jgi:hypothetical protein
MDSIAFAVLAAYVLEAVVSWLAGVGVRTSLVRTPSGAVGWQ